MRTALAWLGLGPLALAICVGLGVVLGVGGYTFHYAEGLAYLSNDPRACVNCHIMRDHYDGWQHASHHAVATCNDCHTPHNFIGKYVSKAENGIRHSWGFTFQDFAEPIRIRPHNGAVLQHNCIDCHEGLVSELLRHASPIGVEEPSCVHCHPAVGHGPAR